MSRLPALPPSETAHDDVGRPLRHVRCVAGVVAKEAVAGAQQLEHDGRDQQQPDHDVRREQGPDREDGHALRRQQDEQQHGRRRGQALVSRGRIRPFHERQRQQTEMRPQ